MVALGEQKIFKGPIKPFGRYNKFTMISNLNK